MGAQNSSQTNIIHPNFLKQLSLSTPLKDMHEGETEVHELFSHSSEHHRIMLDKIRIKKSYDCQYVVKIIDSHTVESKNFCSTIIKTYIVVEKPQSLAEKISERISLKMGFQESEIWTLIYSCSLGSLYLIGKNVNLMKLNKNRIFIDKKGCIKINDPEFSQVIGYEHLTEYEFIQSIVQVVKDLKNIQPIHYSDKLETLLEFMVNRFDKLNEVQNWIKENYLENKTEVNLTLEGFSSARKTHQRTKSKQRIKVLSGRKNSSNFSTQSFAPTNETSIFTNYESVSSYNCSHENKDNNKENDSSRVINLNTDIFSHKDPLKSVDINISTKENNTESHLFPKKTLFGQRKRMQEKQKEPLSEEFFSKMLTTEAEKKTESVPNENHSVFVDSEVSLEGSQLLNLVSYQVDQETFVREVCQEQSEYFLELMNKAKFQDVSPES